MSVTTTSPPDHTRYDCWVATAHVGTIDASTLANAQHRAILTFGTSARIVGVAGPDDRGRDARCAP